MKGVCMKKYFALILLAALATATASARSSRAARSGSTSTGGRSIHALGFAVPLQWQTWENDADIMDLSAAGFNFMYHHLDIRPSRFSTFMDVQLGYTSFTIDEIDNWDIDIDTQDIFGSLSGFNTRYVVGIGGAPVVADNFTLAVHGTFGVHLAYVTGSSTYIEDSGVFGFWTTVGASLDAAWRITNRIGVLAGIDMYTNLYGIGAFWFEDDSYSETFYINPGNFNVDFRVGIAFIY